jgi:hypothetical protein
MNSHSHDLADVQLLVQQALGRCLLRIQQYEKLLKKVVARSELQGALEEFPSLQQSKIDTVQTKTLGQLVRLLTDDYLIKSEPSETDDALADQPGWARIRARMILSEERYQETTCALTELVALRNLLVHHFIDRFDLWSLDGCRQAQTFLAESYETVAGHHLELIEWAKSMNATRAQLHSAALDFIDGVGADGVIAWPQNGITDSLLLAEEAIARDGWTSLSEAIKWCSEHHPAQNLRRYRCASWREVIHKSGLFEIQKTSDSESGITRIFYRS